MSNAPAVNNDIKSLWEPFRAKVILLLQRMTARGEDPVIYEALRTRRRQEYLYSIGRTRDKHRKPVTWTMNSRHFAGKAADIISRKHGWGSDEFYQVLLEEVRKLPELQQIPQETCHVEWHG